MAAPAGKRLIRSKSGLRIIPLKDADRSPFELGEPAWIPDNQSPECMECQQKFDFIKRRHHCRRCGRVCCSACCKARLALPRMCFLDPVRLCGPCATTTATENKFYHHYIKALLSGAILCLSGEGFDSHPNLASCRLSADHRLLQINGEETSLDMPIHRLTALQVIMAKGGNESEEGPDSSGAEETSLGGHIFEGCAHDACSSVALTYRMADGVEEAEVHLTVPPDAPPSAYAFLGALHRAATMAMEARPTIGL